MNFRKIIALTASILLIFVTGCKTKEQENHSQNNDNSINSTLSTKINLIYSSKDTLNPYTCVTAQNKVVTQLMFDSLVVLKNNYKTEYNIAENITYNNKVCSIELLSVAFSDGTPLTAADVVFSFEAAKKSQNYSSSLQYAVSAEAIGTKTVSITLSRDDPYFINLLTFPIIKSGSDTLTDSDNRILPPIGSGKYVFSVDEKKLVINSKYHGSISKIDTITLTDCPDEESVNQTLSTGAVDFYFTDLANNIIPKMNGTAVDVTQSRIVFLGINPKSSRLNSSYFRQAVSAALNRTEICATAYYSKAEPAKGPFPSSWEDVANLQATDTKQNLETVHSNIVLAGFSTKNEDGFYLLKNKEPITLTLLVSSDNLYRYSAANIIKKNLESAGIKINLVAVNNQTFNTELSAERYDLYIGEINIHNNLDLGGLVKLNSANSLLNSTVATTPSSDTAKTTSTSLENVVSGDAAQNLTTADIYNGFYNGTYTVKDLASAFLAELPVIPVCFRSGLVIYSEKLGTGISPVISDLFYNIENIK